MREAGEIIAELRADVGAYIDEIICLKAELAEALGEIAELKADAEYKLERIDSLKAELAAAHQEIAALKGDAERYRWLRGCTKPNVYPFWAICPPAPAAACISGEELDAAIDAAMEGKK